MKAKLKKLNANISDISKDINTLLSEKYNIKNLNVSSIHFTEQEACPPGMQRRCIFYGMDPATGEPVVICTCVPIG